MGEERARFGLGAALVVSVVLHLVLVAVAWMIPARAQTEPAVFEETTLRFDLTPTVPESETIELGGQVPFPTPARPQESPPPPSPEPAEAPPLPPPSVEEPEAQVRDQAREGLDVPGDGIESEGRTESTRSSEAAARERRRLDLDNALRDFGRALRQPQPEGDGSGKGLNIPDLPPFPTTGFGFGNLEFESRDFDWNDYARQIYMAIWRAWHNRLYVTADVFERWGYENRSWILDHANRITFTIESNGQVTGIAIETPSGSYPLDDSAVDALTEVILPPLPSDFPRSRETVHARFIADGDVRTMRRYLGWLKSEGYF